MAEPQGDGETATYYAVVWIFYRGKVWVGVHVHTHTCICRGGVCMYASPGVLGVAPETT